MSYGFDSSNSYSNRYIPESQLPVELEKKEKENLEPPESNSLDPKTSEVSQSIISKASSSSKYKPLSEHKAEPKSSSEITGIAKRAVSLSPGFSDSQNDPSRLDLIKKMSKQELADLLLDETLTDEELDQIDIRDQELELEKNQKIVEASEIILESAVVEAETSLQIEIMESQLENLDAQVAEVEAQRAKLDRLAENTFTLQKDGSLKRTTVADYNDPTSRQVVIDPRNGKFRGDANVLQNFKVGQKVALPQADGSFLHVTATKLKEQSKAQMDKFKHAFISYQARLLAMNNRAETIEKEAHNNVHDVGRERVREPGENDDKADKDKKTLEQIKPERFFGPEIGTTLGESPKELNEKRLKALTEYLDQKLEKILKDVQLDRYETETIRYDESYRDLKNKNFELSELKRGVLTETLKTELRKAASSLQIPLATLEKFEEFTRAFEQFSKMIPTVRDPKNLEAQTETVNLRTEIMQVVSDMITSSGTVARAGTGHDGKTASAA